MINCPKCRSYRITGPSYHKGGYGSYGQESLVYRCSECGFQSHEPTADADAQAKERLPFDAVKPPS